MFDALRVFMILCLSLSLAISLLPARTESADCLEHYTYNGQDYSKRCICGDDIAPWCLDGQPGGKLYCGRKEVDLGFTLENCDSRCPTGWFYSDFNKRCYMINRQLRRWGDAMTFCHAGVGGYLACLNTRDACNVIKDFFAKFKPTYVFNAWIALTDQNSEGIFVWDYYYIRLDASSWTNWIPSSRNSISKSCVEVQPYNDMGWNLESCEANQSSICETAPLCKYTTCPSGTVCKWIGLSYSLCCELSPKRECLGENYCVETQCMGLCVSVLNVGPQCQCAPGWTGVNCESDINECRSGPCLNGARCLDNWNEFKCLCRDGFGGANCSINYRNDCASNPCFTSATCVDDGDYYICLCPHEFTGVRCEIKMVACASRPCSSGASGCLDNGDNYQCVCKPGYQGSLCDRDVDECMSNPCLNGGICSNHPNEYKCTCPPTASGTNCQTVSPCKSNPCKNGATCVVSSSANPVWTCTCTPGYTGVSCDVDLDECMSNPCLNGGICANTVNKYKCTCPPTASGTNCQTVVLVSPCKSNPCKNGATCVVSGSANTVWTCTCTPGYTGVSCDVVKSRCLPNPCKNGGSCRDAVCSCVSAYTGINCEIEINECASIPCLEDATCTDLVDGYSCRAAPTPAFATDATGQGGLGQGGNMFESNGTVNLHQGRGMTCIVTTVVVLWFYGCC